jgi:hypothetical protein
MIKCTSKINLIGLTQQGAQMGRTNSPKTLLLILQNLSFNYFNCLNEIEKYLKLDRGENLGKHYSLLESLANHLTLPLQSLNRKIHRRLKDGVKPMTKCTSKINLNGLAQEGHYCGKQRTNSPKMLLPTITQNLSVFNYFTT